MYMFLEHIKIIMKTRLINSILQVIPSQSFSVTFNVINMVVQRLTLFYVILLMHYQVFFNLTSCYDHKILPRNIKNKYFTQ